jgi:hypothetical protein
VTDPIVPATTFNWIVTVLTALGTFWVSLDWFYMARLRGRGSDMKDPVNRDKRFGYSIGILIGIFTTTGILRFHGVV